MQYISAYEKVFHELYLKARGSGDNLRQLASALRGRISEDSATRSKIVIPLAIGLFPHWRNCYKYLYLKSETIVSRRVRYRLKEEHTDVTQVPTDDRIALAFMAAIETVERYLEGTNPQSLPVFVMNTLPLVYSQQMKEVGRRYRGAITREYMIINEPPDSDQEEFVDNQYRERHLIGMSKTKFYRILQSSDFQGSR